MVMKILNNTFSFFFVIIPSTNENWQPQTNCINITADRIAGIIAIIDIIMSFPLQAILVLHSLFLFQCSSAAVLGHRRHEIPTQRSIRIKNQTGRRFDVLWINNYVKPTTYHSNNDGEGYQYGAEVHLLSYVGHQFLVKEMPSTKTGKCKIDGNCQTTTFTVNDQEDQSK